MSNNLERFVGRHCCYCLKIMGGIAGGANWPSRDHVKPRIRGGKGGTIFICCVDCNNKKGSMKLTVFLKSHFGMSHYEAAQLFNQLLRERRREIDEYYRETHPVRRVRKLRC